MRDSLQQEIDQLSLQTSQLNQQINQKIPNFTISQFRKVFTPLINNINLYTRIQNQHQRLYSSSWAGPGSSRNPHALNLIATVSNTSELLVWNIQKLKPVYKSTIRGEDPWLMTCAFQKKQGCLLAAAGMQGKVWMYSISLSKNQLVFKPHTRIGFQAHSQYVSALDFLSPVEILTASGDCSCKVWNIDLQRGPLRELLGHSQDVMTVATSPETSVAFLSGSCDKTVKYWDLRDRNPDVLCFSAHGDHVNQVKFMHQSPNTFLTGCSDGFVRIFDMRTLKPLAFYKHESEILAFETSVSGRLLFTGDKNGGVKVWDVFDERASIYSLEAHSQEITSIQLSPLGETLASTSCDSSLALWKSFNQ